ncbi:OLC1v1000170C1 [Oldenlandia corymbosa var. corymbosa]|uniref:OLC1v1000170C1 n=1 Tax=Oldenlandia corymbosa var. corymbosa TaxID=529605 RepID=A0AAV1D2A6_OLDCO|nr:OLC1v1000170C1 [Oldenlandia corymbosa var. corymbosa]
MEQFVIHVYGSHIYLFILVQFNIKMSRAQEPNRPFLPFGNPFKMMLPKGSYLSPKLIELLNSFEKTLAQRFRNLKPQSKEDILTLGWMKCAMESLSAIHTDIKELITGLELPVGDWDEKWVDVYLDNSVKLLDLCIAFSSEISRVNQGHLYLKCVVHHSECASSNKFVRACSSLDGWKQHISSKNPRMQSCFTILENLIATLDLPKIKNSSKGKVLMRAMYGVKVATVFVCKVFAAAFSGSAEKFLDLHVPETLLWAEAFNDLQAFVNGEIRSKYFSGKATVLKELEAVDASVKKLYPIVQEGGVDEEFKSSSLELGKSAEKLSEGLDSLAKEVDGFFQIVLTGRDALLCNLRVGTNVADKSQVEKKNVAVK